MNVLNGSIDMYLRLYDACATVVEANMGGVHIGDPPAMR